MELLSLTFHLFFIFLSCQLQTLSAEIFWICFQEWIYLLDDLNQNREVWDLADCVKAWLDWWCSQGVFITQSWRVRSACLAPRYFLAQKMVAGRFQGDIPMFIHPVHTPSYLPSPTNRRYENTELRYHLKSSDPQTTTYAVTHQRTWGKNGRVEEMWTIFIHKEDHRWFVGWFPRHFFVASKLQPDLF